MSSLFTLKKATPIAIARTSPFTALQTELERAIQDFYTPTFFEGIDLLPRMDIVDDTNTFKVEVEMPGMGEKDVKVSIANGVLRITGEKSTSTKDKGKNYVLREISYGNYEREIVLPESVDTDKAAASFKKGMLWITMPKKAGTAATSRQITVENVEKK